MSAAFVAAILSSPGIACAQHYFLVVGAFAGDEKASEFKGYLPDQSIDTSYTFTHNDNLMHFYVLRTSDKESAISKAMQLKEAVELLKAENSVAGSHPEAIISGAMSMSKGVEEMTARSAEGTSASASAGPVASNAAHIPPKAVGKYFKFNIESPEGKPLAAKVHRVDLERGEELATYSSNTFVDLLRPGQTNEPMAVVCGIFGYKEICKYVNYSDPSRTDEEAYVDAEGTWIIPYRLERVEEGDVSPMYNVSFFKDAAIMRRSSLTDLDELVRMMHMNPNYEITIHAHCNGRQKREIIAPGADRNYFDAAGSVKVKGSAKTLTGLRAETVRGYLIEHGINPARIDIFSWGASDMLVKSDNPQAGLNNRIEIEFMRD